MPIDQLIEWWAWEEDMTDEAISITAEITVRIDPEAARTLGRLLFDGIQLELWRGDAGGWRGAATLTCWP